MSEQFKESLKTYYESDLIDLLDDKDTELLLIKSQLGTNSQIGSQDISDAEDEIEAIIEALKGYGYTSFSTGKWSVRASVLRLEYRLKETEKKLDKIMSTLDTKGIDTYE